MGKMVESCRWWFGYMWRGPIETLIRKVDQTEGNLIARGNERPRKTIGNTIEKDLDFECVCL